ncbi:MAG: hypothetical protein NVSMB65_05510 [Chloroflexota bacterium]
MRRIIVDGYNVINADEHLLYLKRHSLDAARRGLIMRLRQAQRLRHDEVTVVFDGWQTGASHESVTRMEGIRVVYSRRGERADEVIKRLVSQAPDPGVVVMVSNDRDLLLHAGEQGAGRGSVDNLMQQATPARRPRPHPRRSDLDGRDKDADASAARRGVSPTKKGPARRLPRNQRPGRTQDYRF